MKKQFFTLAVLLYIAITAQAQEQDTYTIYCGESITLMPDGGSLGTNATWKWYTGSCGGTLAGTGNALTVNPTTAATYYVRAEGSCGTTTCRSVVVNIKAPSFSIVRLANQATEGCLISFIAKSFPAGGTIKWSGATSTGDNAATVTMRQAAATSTVGETGGYYKVSATYTIAAGSGCSSTANNYTGYTATCPYTGNDLVTGTCYQDGAGAGNWRAQILDARISGTAELNANEGRKYYNVVQMADGKWWMAQNLDYRKGLTWFNDARSYTSGYVGTYWCPGANGATFTTKAGCNIYGSLYPQGAIRASGGTGTVAEHSSADPSGVQGICPNNWHLPSDTEWGKMLDCAEGNCNSGIHYPVLSGYHGNTGRLLKSANTCPKNDPECTTLSNPQWYYDSLTAGTDYWGFNLIPAGGRSIYGYFEGLGTSAIAWTSSEQIVVTNWVYNQWTVNFKSVVLSRGFSVRCVRN